MDGLEQSHRTDSAQNTGKKLWSRLGESLCEVFSFHKMSLAQLRLTSGCVHL